ncbi:MAG TPA: argininosuccinate lyase [Anaerolineales bacterium]
MKLWGGRFSERMDPDAWALNASISFDQRLARQDVRGSQAWARGLAGAGVLTSEEADQICAGLQAIGEEFAQHNFVFQESDEDIHTAVERRLGERIGPLAGKLHTGRSRNDQVATDLRLWLLDSIPWLDQAIAGLQATLVAQAEAGQEVLMPGYTHLQRAQPVLLAHWWLSHFWPLQRDRERLSELAARTAVLPLGSGALAGTPFPIDRDGLASQLGFARPSPNSMDAVSDRDFVAEFLFCAALLGVHLSRLAEDVILFSSAEFGFFELADAYTSGSSLMPQKKNPDVFELARGKSGSLIGQLTGLLASLKGLPSTYDKDLQEDKLPLFSAYDTLLVLLPVLGGALRTATARPERMQAALDDGLMATDLADFLIQRGLPFREAHNVVGAAVQLAARQGLPLHALSLSDLRSLSPAFGSALSEADLRAVFDPWQSVTRRSASGGTGPQAVAAQIQQAREALPPDETQKK